MKQLIKYCPFATRCWIWLWNSPTFTTWGNYSVQSLRLLIVTPLILTRFNETEIASWYLFASLNFFGATVSQRLGLTFSRMLAFAMGGASTLEPIKGKRKLENNGNPNWAAFERAYGTIGSLNIGIGWLNVLTAFGMGWFGLNNLLQGYDSKGVIWLAFSIMQMSSLLSFIFQRYGIALEGMNYIAMRNRWSIIFSLLSSLAGSITLWVGGGLVALVFVMQFFNVVGVYRDRFLLHSIEGGCVLKFRQYGFDREVFKWGWEPTWKGLVAQIGQSGSVQLTAIIYSTYAVKSDVTSYLFALRMMQTITQISYAPFASIQPYLSRLISMGDIVKLRTIFVKRSLICLFLFITAVFIIGFGLSPALQFIGSEVQFLSIYEWLMFGILTLMVRFNVICASVSTLGNEMIYYWHTALGGILGILTAYIIRDNWGGYGPIIASLLPMVIVLNAGPYRRAVFILGKE